MEKKRQKKIKELMIIEFYFYNLTKNFIKILKDYKTFKDFKLSI